MVQIREWEVFRTNKWCSITLLCLHSGTDTATTKYYPCKRNTMILDNHMKLQLRHFGIWRPLTLCRYMILIIVLDSKMTGIEFAVVHDQPPVWIIQKRYRRGPAPDDVNPIATYYIMGANVYQSPTIYSVIANRLVRDRRSFSL